MYECIICTGQNGLNEFVARIIFLPKDDIFIIW